MIKSKTNRLPNRKLRVLLGLTFAIMLVSSFVVIEMIRSQKNSASNESQLAIPQNAQVDPKNASSVGATTPTRKTYYAWFESDPSTIERPDEMPAEAVYVSLYDEFDKWLIGSKVVVKIPQTNELHRTVVDRMESDDFGNQRIWVGPDVDEEEFSQLILTVSDGQTLAYVSTEHGNYELTGTSDGGWLVPTKVLQAKIDTTKKDVLGRLRDRHTNTKYVPKRTN